MKISGEHLELLAAVVDEGGVTEGAAFLGKSQPSVSRSLRELQQRIGISLFVPGRRPLQPTELGLLLARHGRTVLEATEGAATVVAGFRGGRIGTVRLGGSPFFLDGVVSNIVALFRTGSSGVVIEQSYGYLPDLCARLVDRTLDLAICPAQRDALPPGVEFEQLLVGRNVIACREDHPLRRRLHIRRQDLAEFPWIVPPPQSPLLADFGQVEASFADKTFDRAFSGGTLISILNMLIGSDSMTVLPYSVVFAMGKTFPISALRLQIDHPQRVLGILQKEGKPLAPAASRLKRHLIGSFDSLRSAIEHHERSALWVEHK